MSIDECPHAEDLHDCTCPCPFDSTHASKDCNCTFEATARARALLMGAVAA